MFMQHDEIDVASQSMQMLSAFYDCLLARYRWIAQAMRSLMAGESRPALQTLPGFERCLPRSLDIPSTLLQRFETERTRLEALWDQVVDVKNIRIDLPLYQQLDELQRCSEYFMRQADEACQRLRCDFALRDPLTGALSHLLLKPGLHAAQERAQRFGQYCSLILLNLSGLTDIHERWREDMKNQVQVQVAKLIKKQLRPNDLLYRLAPDKWLVLLPETASETGEHIAQRIHRPFSDESFVLPDGSVFTTSMSYGVASSRNNESIDRWISRADAALHAKLTRSINTEPPSIHENHASA